jgi:hypothetical protein
MALFGSDRPVMPSFKTPTEPGSSVKGLYDDLNRIERNGDRNSDRSPARQPERGDDRNGAELRVQDRLERPSEGVSEHNGRDNDRNADRIPVRELEPAAAAPVKPVQQASWKGIEGTHPLIEGLFSKLPEPEAQWPLAARQKWLQTAASIFDLMYAANDTDAGELAVRVERTSAR